jgi:NADPH-dependent ferric siderophore reductase
VRRRLLDPFFSEAQIVSVEQLGPTVRQLRLAGPSLRHWDWTPGQQLRVQVGGLPGPLDLVTGLRRTYSVWAYDGETVDLCVIDHGEGPGARWAREARPGDTVLTSKPQGDFVLRPSPHHLLVGEETASVAFGAMLRAMPSDEIAHAVVEIDEPDNALPLPVEAGWHYRHDQPAASSQSLVDAVRELTLPRAPMTAYLAGEARTIQLVRRHLVTDRGWNRRDILTKPFWTPGKTGLE